MLRRFELETTASHLMSRPLTRTPVTRSLSTWIFSQSLRIRTSTPLFFSSAPIAVISLSVPPSNVKTPFDMKFEKTMP